MSDFQMGLYISAIGLSVTFLALLIFIGVIVLLQKLFPVKTESKEAEVVELETPSMISVKADEGDEEIVAAVAAVTYLRTQRAGQLGAALVSGPGPFRSSR